MSANFRNYFNKLNRICLAVSFFSLVCIVQAQDPLKLIPSGASGVLTMDGGNFFQKIDLAQINRLEMFRELDEETQGRRGKTYAEYSKIYKDPASVGLNLNSKLYLYFEHSADTSYYGTRFTYTGLIAPLSNSKKFESFLKKVSDSTVHKAGSYKYAMTGYSNVVAWNKSQVIVLYIDGWSEERSTLLVNQLKRITTLNSEATIRTNKNFMDAQNSKFDFLFWMSFESFFRGMGLMNQLALPIFKDLPFASDDFYDENYFHTALNFEKGNITIAGRQFITEKSAKQVENIYGKGINPILMNYIHKDHLLGACSYSLNMKGVKSMLDTALHDTIKMQMNEGFIDLLYGSKFKEDAKLKALNKEIDSLYSSLYSYNYNYDDYATDTASVYEEEPAYEDYDNDSYEENTQEEEGDGSNDYQDPGPDYYENEEEPNESEEQPYETEEQPYETEEEPPYETEEERNDLTTPAPIEDVPYSYEEKDYSKEDSIYKAKQAIIDTKRQEATARRKDLQEKKLKELGIKGTDLLELFEGDVLAAVTDYHFVPVKFKTYDYEGDNLEPVEVEKTRLEPRPDLLFAFTLNNVEKTTSLIRKLQKDSFLIAKKHYYSISAGDFTLFAAITGKVFLITTNEDLLTKNINGFSQNEVISKEVKDLISNKSSAVYVSLKDIFARLPYQNMSKNRQDLYTLLMNSMLNVSYVSPPVQGTVNTADFKFELTNKIDNSFFEIFRIINEIYLINKSNY